MVNYQLAVVYTRHEKVIAMKPWAGIFNFFLYMQMTWVKTGLENTFFDLLNSVLP
jgi:hypothetical protein